MNRKMLIMLLSGITLISGALSFAEEAKSDKQQEIKAKYQTTCPVMGGKINKKLFVDVKGKRVYVCCSGCIDKIKKNPEKYIKKLEKEGVTIEKAETEDAKVAVAENWLALVDDEKYAESWQNAAEYFKNAVKQEQWEHAMRAARQPLGKLVSRRAKSTTYKTSLPGAPDGKYVIIEFETEFENKKTAIETVTPMMDKDGKWRVSGYFIK